LEFSRLVEFFSRTRLSKLVEARELFWLYPQRPGDSDQQEDNHRAEGDGREIGEEQEKGAESWSGQMAG
jgi:hypothetical protein